MAGMSQLEQLVFTVLPKGGFQFTPSIIIHKCAKIGMQHRESSFEIQCEKSRILTVCFTRLTPYWEHLVKPVLCVKYTQYTCT